MRLGFLLACWLLCSLPLMASLDPGPALPACRVEAPPVVDGDLEDVAWGLAPRVTGFVRMDVDRPPAEQTEAWICYDRSRLYAAFRCHDRLPGRIVAIQTKRNGNIHHDDQVFLSLDPRHDHQGRFFFAITANGTQSESIPGGSAAQVGWKGDWQAAARLVPGGWQAELAIPLAMLRYPPGQDTFGVQFGRLLSREREWSVWPFLGAPREEADRAANLVGLQLPALRPPTVVMPYLLSEAREGSRRPLSLGLDLKRTLPGGLVAVGTLHPDFRTIEDEVLSIDYTYTEQYRDERRPFFTEGGGYLPSNRIFYTPRIGSFDLGAKLSGSVGNRQYGLLYAAAPGASEDLAARFALSPTLDNSLSLGMVSHWGGEQEQGFAWEADYAQQQTRSWGALGFSAGLSGSDGPAGRGLATSLGLSRRLGVGHWDHGLSYSSVSRGFTPPLGYTPEVGLRQLSLWANRDRRYDQGRCQQASSYVSAFTGPADDGYRNGLSLYRRLSYRSGRWYSGGANLEQREAHADATVRMQLGWNHEDFYRTGRVGFTFGRRAGGRYRFARASQGWRFGTRAYGQVELEHLRMTPPDDIRDELQAILTLGYDLDPEHGFSFRLIDRSGRCNASASYRQQVRQGCDAFLVLGDPNSDTTEARAALKLVWPLLY